MVRSACLVTCYVIGDQLRKPRLRTLGNLQKDPLNLEDHLCLAGTPG